MDLPGLNPLRWVLVTIAAGAVGFGRLAGAGLVPWLFYGLAALASLGILLLLFGPTIVPSGVTRREQGVYDHPDGKYKHGYSLALVSLAAPIQAALDVWCDAPIHDFQVAVEETRWEPPRVERKLHPCRRVSDYHLVISPPIPRATGFHVRVYSTYTIRTVCVHRRKPADRRRA